MDMDLSAPWIIAPPVRVLFLPDKAGVSEALHTLERRLRLILNPISIANLAIFNQLDWGKQCAEFFAEASLEMDLPANDAELVPEKIEDGKEEGPSFKCDLSDTEIVHKIAQAFLPGLASACVDSTSGGIFKSPASVAVDMRKDLVDYLTQRSESFIAEFVILEAGPGAEVSDHPYDIVSDFVDDFASSKRNLFSRVSGWLLSEKREDKIDDFVQEMEINGFWLLDKREAIAHTLLKNVDFKNAFHCNGKFMSAEGLAEHVCHCSFRSLTCTNEGCNARFCASQLEKHDSVCPFKIVPCEQKCSGSIMRREMDRHCITVCPMKLVNCPFYALGCPSAIPYCVIEQHCSDTVHFHLLYVLQVIHKEASEEDLKRRVDQLEQAASSSWLAEAREVRSLTSKVKDLEAKLGPLEVHIKNKDSEENVEISNISNALDEAHINKDSQERMGTLNLPPVEEQGEETRMHTIHLFQQHQGDGFCRCGDGLYLRMLQKIMRTDSINFIAISKPFSLAADDDYRFMNRKSKMKDLPSQKTPVLLKRECFSSELNLTAQETIVKFSSCLFKFVVWDKKTSFSIRSNVFTIVHCSRPNYADISKDLHAD